MRLYLVRHGEALPPDIDPEQPLSSEGKRDADSIAQLLKEHHIAVGHIFHSVKLRAKETAKIIANAIAPKGVVEERGGLKPLDPIEPLLPEIVAYKEDVMLVGHLPFLSRLLSTLLFEKASERAFDFQSGSVACIEHQNGLWSLKWLITPLFGRLQKHL